MSTIQKISNAFQNHRWLRHVSFWLAVLLITIPKNALEQEHSYTHTFVMSLCIMVSQILLSYFLGYVIVPKFLTKKKYVTSLGLFVMATYIFLTIGRILVVYVGEPLVRQPPFEQETIFEIFAQADILILHYIPSVFPMVFVFLFIKYFLESKRMTENELKLTKEKVAVELQTLKNQLNPHFLFNTLNNIYVLSLEKSPKTPESIAKLSNILDHVLYRCNAKYVPISTEIALLENYIELEKLRYDERLQVNFNNNIERDGEIAPLLLLSLVENAFKHGAGEDSGSPTINIDIYNTESMFTFVIANTVFTTAESKERTPIGLKNIQQQLELIYPGAFELEIANNANIFTVTVKIKTQ